MAKSSSQDGDWISGIVTLLVIIFIAGGYIVAWWTIQVITFWQDMFWVHFWFIIILILATLFFFIWFLIEPKENHNGPWGYNFYNDKFFTKSTIGLFSIGLLILSILFMVGLPQTYEKGYSEEKIIELFEAQEKLEEFNYIKRVLTGEEIERILVEGFDEAFQEICDPNIMDCNLLRSSYESVRDILEAKQKADNIAETFGFIEE